LFTNCFDKRSFNRQSVFFATEMTDERKPFSILNHHHWQMGQFKAFQSIEKLQVLNNTLII
jgi:hypothetical protein